MDLQIAKERLLVSFVGPGEADFSKDEQAGAGIVPKNLAPYFAVLVDKYCGLYVHALEDRLIATAVDLRGDVEGPSAVQNIEGECRPAGTCSRRSLDRSDPGDWHIHPLRDRASDNHGDCWYCIHVNLMFHETEKGIRRHCDH